MKNIAQNDCRPIVDRYFMQLAYNGLPFHGWQRQPNALSVQQKLEEAMAMVFRLPDVAIVGAGRTDAGVSAAKMIAHFDLPRKTHQPLVTPDIEPRILRALNSLLAPDIVVYRIWKVHPQAHARFDAVSRSYRYFAHTRRSPFTGQFSWLAPETLNFRKMNEAAAILLDTEDFTSFSKLHTDVKTNICHVTHAAWRPQDAPDCESFDGSTGGTGGHEASDSEAAFDRSTGGTGGHEVSDCEAAFDRSTGGTGGKGAADSVVACEGADCVVACEGADCVVACEGADCVVAGEGADCVVADSRSCLRPGSARKFSEQEPSLRRAPSLWVFEITADRFLRNMVRAVVGTLVDVGRGKLSIADFREIIDRRDRCAAGTSMPPGPLFLHDIRYPY